MMEQEKVKIKDYTHEFFGEGKTLTAKRREELILSYTPLVKYVAARLVSRLPSHILPEDLVGAGIIGLMDAIEKFDESKKIKFKTYAEFRIRGAILDELRSLDWVPRSVRKKASQLEKVSQKLEKELGRPAEDEELAQVMGLTMDEYYKLLDQTRNVQFLDIDIIRRRMPEGNDDDLFDLIADEGEHDPFELLNLTELKDLLVHAITNLPEKEKLVISLYYYEQLTMREIGEIMGYTESRISQMHTTAMMRLRGEISSLREELDGDMVM